MAAVPAPEEFTLMLKPSEMAALLTVIGTSPMLTRSNNNAKFVQDVDKELSRYYTLAELGVVSMGAENETATVCVNLFEQFQRLVRAKMEATKAKLCLPLKS
jgi:hypothetical protein